MKKIDTETIYNIVFNLIGSINPVGATDTDKERKENLRVYIDLMNMLIDDVYFLIDKRNDYRESVNEIGTMAYEEFRRLSEFFDEVVKLEGEDNE